METDTNKRNETEAFNPTEAVVANADSVTFASRTMRSGITVGSEGKPNNETQRLTTTITKVVDELNQVEHYPRVDLQKNKSIHYSCVKCNKKIDICKRRKRNLNDKANELFLKYLRAETNKNIHETDIACNACYQVYTKIKTSQTSSNSQQSISETLSESQASVSDIIESEELDAGIKYRKIEGDDIHCIICKERCQKTIPRSAAVDIFMRMKIFAPSYIRCCNEHLNMK